MPTPSEPTIIIDVSETQPSSELPEPTPEPPNVNDNIYQNTDPSGQVVTFWHPYTSENEKAMLEIAADFNATNPWNINVIPEYQGSYNDIFDKMLTFMNSNDAPSLVAAYQNQAATYQLAGALIDIDEMVYSERWGLSMEEINDFFPAFFYQDVFSSFGNIRLGFPPHRSMEVLYYNQDWLAELGYDAPPTTPEEFKEMACAATAQPYSGATAEGSIGYLLSTDASRFASFTFAFDGDIFDYINNKYTYDSLEAVAAMEFIQELFNEGCAKLVGERYGDQIEFSQGTTLFTIGSSSSLLFYQSAVQTGSNHNWSVAPIPHTIEEPVQNIYGASISIPRTTPENQLAAWLFLKFFSSPEIQARWAAASNYFPVRASTTEFLSNAGYFDTNPAYETAFSMLQFGTSEPPVAGYHLVRDMVAESMFAISQGADVLNVLTSLNADANYYLGEQLAVIPETPDPWANIDPSGQTIIFWHQIPPASHATLNEIVWKFNSTNKWGITVIAEYQDDINKKMKQVVNSPDIPNLVEMYQSQTADLQLSGTFSDMTSLVESIKWGLSPQDQADFYSGIYFQDIYPTFGNIRLGFPPHRSMIVMYYNADWLAELKTTGAIESDGIPQNPEQFKTAACAAAANPFSDSVTETSMGYQLRIDASIFVSWIFAFGGDVFNYENNQYSFNNEAAVDAMTFIQGLFSDDCAGLIVERYGDQTDFSQGALLFTIDSTSGLPYYQSGISESGSFDWSVAPLPHTIPEPDQNVYGASLSIPKGTPEAELAAWLFTKYFVSPVVQTEWVQTSNYLPVRASVAGGLTDYFAANPAYGTAFEMLPYSASEPSVPGYDFVRDMVEEAMAAITEGADVQATLDRLTEDANINLAEQKEQ